MSHWKLILAYDGTPYNGWQIQPNLPTVQGSLADAIHHVTGEHVLPQGSGRTDTGVHALGQVASFTLASPIPPANLQRALNRILPTSIRVVAAEEAPESFHARHSARSKTYEYRIASQAVCFPMLAPFVWNCTWPLDLEQMQKAAEHVIGTHDFTSFAATDPELSMREPASEEVVTTSSGRHRIVAEAAAGTQLALEDEQPPKTFIRTIYQSTWRRRGDLLCYMVTGSGFLHHMVRNLVGTFVDVGRGRTPADSIPSVLAACSRSAAGPTAPPQGLFLVEVHYDPEEQSIAPARDIAM